MRRLEYWKKKIWIIPIHIPLEMHWVLAVVYLESGTIRLFDSFAKNHHWGSITKVRHLIKVAICIEYALGPFSIN